MEGAWPIVKRIVIWLAIALVVLAVVAQVFSTPGIFVYFFAAGLAFFAAGAARSLQVIAEDRSAAFRSRSNRSSMRSSAATRPYSTTSARCSRAR
jgi:hypothetical protein